MRIRKRSETGYTLVEALVVVAIVGMISLVSVPAFTTMYRSNQLRVSARQAIMDLRWARQLAVTRQRAVKFSVTPGAGQKTYRIYLQDASPAITWPAAPVRSGTLQSNNYFVSTTFADCDASADALVAADSDTAKDVIFLSSGAIWRPSASNNVVIGTTWNVPRTSYTLSINATGSVTMQ